MRRTVWTAVVLTSMCIAGVASFGDVPPTVRPGAMGGGVTLLPNGWKIAPAGRHVQVGDLPLAMTESPAGRLLFVPSNGHNTPAIPVFDLQPRFVRPTPLTGEPYTCLVSPDGSTLYVSLWGGAKVLIFDAKTLDARGEVATGEHPNALAMTRDGSRLFVACANTNAVWAIDVPRRVAVEQISVAMFPHAPPGSTPNHVSVSPDRKRPPLA